MYSTPSNQLLRTTAPVTGRALAQTRSPGATAAKSPPSIPAFPRPPAATLINLVRTFPHQAPHTSHLHPTPHHRPAPRSPLSRLKSKLTSHTAVYLAIAQLCANAG